MNRNVLIAVGILIVVGIGATYAINNGLLDNNSQQEEVEDNKMAGTPKEDEAQKAVDQATIQEMRGLLYQFSGELSDVTEGAEIRGITTEGNATGVAKANWDGSQYLMVASFENLPEPQGEDFYEGWIVRQDPFEFISTGKAVLVDGVYVNGYRSDMDLTEYDFYVLTLEPNDGDPAPADHIVEGTMVE